MNLGAKQLRENMREVGDTVHLHRVTPFFGLSWLTNLVCFQRHERRSWEKRRRDEPPESGVLTVELLESSNTRLLHRTDEFSFYCLEGTFEEETKLTFSNDLLGVFVCLRGTFFSGTEALTYQLQDRLVAFALKHRCEMLIPKGSDLLVLTLLFPLSTLESIVKKMGTPIHVVLDRFTTCECTVAYGNQEISKAFSRVYKETTDRYPGFELLANATMREILVHFLRLFAGQDTGGCKEGFVIAQIKAYLAANCHNKIGVDEVARYAGYSRSHFSKMFRDATGQSLVQYINNLRVEKACEKIRASEGSIEEVAYEVGFQNLNHFYKTFKKVTGQLPSAFKAGLVR